MNTKSTFSSLWARNIAGCLLALITCTVMIPGMTTYLPLSLADTIAIPILLFPFIWSALFIYCYMAERAWHPYLVMSVLLVSHATLAYLSLTGSKS